MLNIIQKLVDLHSLTEAEAETAMNSIMDGKTTDAQIGSFLTALRIKGETPDEIAGFVKVMINKARKIHPKGKTLLDTCGTGGDNSNTFNISTAVAFVVAGAGIPVVKHGNRSVSSKCGSADVLQALGVNLAITLENVEDCINKIGIGFLFAPLFHQAMKNVANPRKEIGIRTVFNVLGPLANPARATHQILGVYNEQLTETMAEVLKKRGIKRALVVHGSGLDEITICGKTKITELDKGQIKSYYVFPKDFGIAEANLKEIKGGNPEENAKIILDILNGKEGPKRDIVILNSAAALYMSGKSNSIKEGIAIAKDSIDSGKAMSKLRLLVEQSNSYRGGNGKNNILNKIVGHKKQEIESKKKKLPLDRLRNKISSEESQARDFKKALKKKGEVAIIAEIKKSSPSTGIIRENFDHISIAKDYDKAKVDAISVLTDKRFFGGKLDFIKDIKKVTNVPILRKDFIVDNYQIYE
jgi:anthranilate phosphoribosyltransferase